MQNGLPFLRVMDLTSDQFPTPRLVTAATWVTSHHSNINIYTHSYVIIRIPPLCVCLTLKLYRVSGCRSFTSVPTVVHLCDVQSRRPRSLYSTWYRVNTCWSFTFFNFVTLQPDSTVNQIHFFSLIYTQYLIMTKWNQNWCKCQKEHK